MIIIDTTNDEDDIDYDFFAKEGYNADNSNGMVMWLMMVAGVVIKMIIIMTGMLG